MALLALAALPGLGCSAGAGDRPLRVPDGTPVVLISIDTLRSDRLPAYGYRGVETPAIDGLRRDGILFERAYTHVPLTLPAHASLLTGSLPPTHGVRDNLGYTVDSARTPMLQQALQEAGYATGAAVSAFVLRRETGLAAGFDFYDDDVGLAPDGSAAGIQAAQRAGGATLGAIRPWLEGVAGRPFFLFLHLFEPHAPYRPPPELAARYADPYDGEVAAADAIVGDLLEDLRRLEVYDRAMIVLLSDHGEGLGEHGESEHGVFLYRSTLQVPLILKLPAGERAGATMRSPVQLIDVGPTVLSALGLPLATTLEGTPLLGPSRPDPEELAIYAETFYPRLHFGWSELSSVVVDRHQLIEAPQPELYDLVEDPDQHANLIGSRPGLEERLQAALGGFGRDLAAPAATDPGTRARLEALGYLGEATLSDDEDLPDPKTRVEVLSRLQAAHRLFADGDFAEAASAFEAIVAEEPGLEDAWEYLALSHLGRGRADDAAAVYARAVRAAPGSGRLALRAASLAFRTGRLEEAAELARRGLGHDPAAAHGLLAQVALALGDLDEAEGEARTALAAAGERRAEARRLLAGILAARGELALRQRSWGGARGWFEEALKVDPETSVATLNLGLLDLAEGRPEEARSQIERALASLPTSFEGWNALGMIAAREGDDERAIEAWTRAHELRPEIPDVLFNLGLAHAQAGRFPQAAALLEEFAARAAPGPQRDRALATARELRRRAGALAP